MEKRILDEETRKALQGYLPFSSDVTIDFTPEEFQTKKIPAEFQPKFAIRSMTKKEKEEYTSIYANVKKDADGKTPDSEWKAVGDKMSKIYQTCLKGWRDFFDAGTGEEIWYSEGGFVSEAPTINWDLIPGWIQLSIAAEIRKISNLTPVEMLSLK
jgi:hypothetical protein